MKHVWNISFFRQLAIMTLLFSFVLGGFSPGMMNERDNRSFPIAMEIVDVQAESQPYCQHHVSEKQSCHDETGFCCLLCPVGLPVEVTLAKFAQYSAGDPRPDKFYSSQIPPLLVPPPIRSS